MRRIIITSTFSWEKKGGVPTFVNGIYTESKNSGEEIKVFGIGKSKEDFISVYPGTKRPINYFKLWYNLIRKIWVFRKNSIIEVHNGIVGFPLFFVIKPIYFFHGPAYEEARAEDKFFLFLILIKLLENFILFRSSSFYVASKSFKSKLENYFFSRKKKIDIIKPFIIINPKDLNPSNESKKINNSLNIICVRRLVKRTGVSELISFLKDLSNDPGFNKEINLTIVGSGPELEKIKELSSFVSKNIKIDIKGFVSDAERLELYKLADYNILPTLALEGFGLVVIEAGLLGCPSIVTNVDALPEVVRNTPNSHIYRNNIELKSILLGLKKLNNEEIMNVKEFFNSKYGLNDRYNLLS